MLHIILRATLKFYKNVENQSSEFNKQSISFYLKLIKEKALVKELFNQIL